jgi:hypothetical protein
VTSALLLGNVLLLHNRSERSLRPRLYYCNASTLVALHNRLANIE